MIGIEVLREPDRLGSNIENFDEFKEDFIKNEKDKLIHPIYNLRLNNITVSKEDYMYFLDKLNSDNFINKSTLAELSYVLGKQKLVSSNNSNI